MSTPQVFSSDAPAPGLDGGKGPAIAVALTKPAYAQDRLLSPLVQRHGAPESGVELGYGWDGAQSKVIPNRCVVFAPVLSTGQSASVDLHEVSDQSEIMDRLNVSASASVNSTFGSGSAQASFARSSQVSAKSTTLLLRAVVENSALFAGPKNPGCDARKAFPAEKKTQPLTTAQQNCESSEVGNFVTYTEEAKKLAQGKDKNEKEFIRMCGDGYVSAIYSGAELLATISITSTGGKSSSEVKASVEASFGVGQVGAEYGSDKAASRESADLTVRFSQVGGGGGLLPISRDGLTKKMQALALETAQDPKFVAIEVTSYRAVDEKAPQRERSVREISADYYWFLTSLEKEIAEILAKPADYDFTTGLDELSLRELQDISVKIRERIRAEEKDETLKSPQHIQLIDSSNESLTFPDTCNQHETGHLPNEKLPTFDDLIAVTKAQGADDLREKLRDVAPYCNPNTLRLYLPVPTSSAGNDPVDIYLRPLAQRMCQLNPADNECLTNAQMDALSRGRRDSVQLRRFRLRNAETGKCLVIIEKTMQFTTTDCNNGNPTWFTRSWDPSWKRHGPPEIGISAGEYALVFSDPGDDKKRWCLNRNRNAPAIRWSPDTDGTVWTVGYCGWSFLQDGRFYSHQDINPNGMRDKLCIGLDTDGTAVAESCYLRAEERHRIRWAILPEGG